MAEKKDEPVKDEDTTAPDTAEPVVEPMDVTNESDVETKDEADTPPEDVSPLDEADFDTDIELENDVETPSTPEPEAAPASEPEPEIAQPAPQVVEQRAGFAPLVFGGVVAAMLGFIAARAEILDNFLPPSMRSTAEIVDMTEQFDALQDALNTANAKIAALEAIEAPTPQDFDASGLEQNIADLGARITTLEDRPVTTTSGNTAPSADYDAAFQKLQDMAAAQQAEIDALLQDARLVEENSEAAAKAALARAAATRIVAAVESGAPFGAALGDLESTGIDVPDALKAAADTGVTQLATLQSDIPDAARAALSASRSVDSEGGLGGFFKRQLGARSVAPREGSDPDAVLSRVEASVREGRLNDALAEAETLPPEGQAAMADWLEQARTRLDVTTATDALMQRLAAN